MGMLLSFVPRTPAPGRPPQLAGVEASIIIFPGVRYEHADKSAEKRKSSEGQREAADKAPLPRH